MMTPLRALRENHARAEGGNGKADTRASTNRLPSRYSIPFILCYQGRWRISRQSALPLSYTCAIIHSA
jgi:hypothetical protein